MRANPIKRELARLKRHEREAWQAWHATRDPQLLETVLRVIDARCRLLGLYPGDVQTTEVQSGGALHGAQ